MDQGKESGPGADERLTRRYLVSGRVQGVGFRYFVRRQAEALGVTGWARNLPGGPVEVHARGSAGMLRNLEDALRRGPRFASVTNVDITEIQDELDPAIGFQIVD